MNQVQDPAFEANLGLDTTQSVTYIHEWNGFSTTQKLYLPFKRLMDIILSVIALIVLVPFFAVVAIAIKLDSPGPVFYLQKNSVGKNKKPFSMRKFRSMVDNAEKMKASLQNMNEMDGPVFKIKNDPRITRIGYFIRKYSIDELPQLINVFLGEMSLVGPRPQACFEFEEWESEQKEKRLSIRPGITCFWQIRGRSNIASFSQWMQMDMEYIVNIGIITDLKILLKTISVVIKGRGAY